MPVKNEMNAPLRPKTIPVDPWPEARSRARPAASTSASPGFRAAPPISLPAGNDDLLWWIVEATSGATGDEFFNALVSRLAMALKLKYVLVTECMEIPARRVRTLAYWIGSTLVPNIEYDLEGTPCKATIIGQQVCFVPRDVGKQFPPPGTEPDQISYYGIPIFDSARERVIGHFTFLDDKVMASEVFANPVFHIFASRAAAELQRRHAEEDGRAHLQQLAHAARAGSMGELAGAIAHEVNQPLTAITSYARACAMLLKQSQRLGPDVKSALDGVILEAERAAAITRRLRGFLSGRDADFVHVSPNFGAQESLELARAEARKRRILLETQFDLNLADALGDPVQIQQSCSIWCAMRLTRWLITPRAPNGSSSARVKRTKGKSKSRLPTTAPVCHATHATRCSTRFLRPRQMAWASDYRWRAPSRKTLAAHWNSMQRTRAAHASCSHCPLHPLRIRSTEPGVNRASGQYLKNHASKETDSVNKVLIVVVDGPVRAALGLFLKASGFATQVYPSGDALLEARDWKDTDCMILDIRMPGLSGMDVLVHPKVSESGVPVIVMTGHGDVPLAVQAMKLGAFDFVEKPFAETALADRIRAAIARGKSPGGGLTAEQAGQRIARLTPREREVCLLVAAGKLNTVIAGDLNLSSSTVEIHRARTMEKTQARSLSELVRIAVALEAAAPA